MTATVPALGLGAVTAAGYVWYAPALVDLRAGADRPASRRLAALACVTGWAGAALAGLLLLVGAPGWVLYGAVVAAGVACAVLRVRAAARHRKEERDTAACWSALGSPVPRRATARPQDVFAKWAGAGLLTALAVAAPLLTWGRAYGVGGTTCVAVPVILAGLALLTARLRAIPRAAAARERGRLRGRLRARHPDTQRSLRES
ncbi:hypothetical protein [Streptomyces vilmorinianum]|uniref:hypothetical protein n=1 Tax=Streptomyces vilmorinianum TaxID=3051092 RepID=UPI001586C7E7|nr:hypothetical protein [Streptomyces vilmorinianum]